MAETLNKTYEGMFLVDSGSTDFNAANELISTVLGRSEGEILSIKAWDERKLAYEMKGKNRGLYVLVYFKADPEKIRDIERDCQLNEAILRVLILRRETVTEEEMAAETPASSAAAKAEAKAEEADTTEAVAVEVEETVEVAVVEEVVVEEAPEAEATEEAKDE